MPLWKRDAKSQLKNMVRKEEFKEIDCARVFYNR